MSGNDLYDMRQKLLSLQNELLKNSINEQSQSEPRIEAFTTASPREPVEDVVSILKDMRENQEKMLAILEDLLHKFK